MHLQGFGLGCNEGGCQVLLALKEMADKLLEIYDELNYPGTKAFLKELRKRGIPAREKDVRDFIQAQPEQQILAAGPTYGGHIYAATLDSRWVADLIDYTSQPVGKTTHVLIVQDIFSRFIWTAPLAGVAQTTKAFQKILNEGRVPTELNTDMGPEWTNAAFKKLCAQQKIEQRFKKGRNDIATIDAAIGVLRQALTKRSARSGKTWVAELALATRGINARSRDALQDSAAKDVEDDIPLRIDLRVQSTEQSLENEERMEKRDAKLQDLGAFRRLENQKSFARGWKPRWSTKLYKVEEVEHGKVVDTEGGTAPTKEVLAVPSDTAALQPPTYVSNVNAARAKAMEPFAAKLAQSLAGRPDVFIRTAAAQIREKQPLFEEARKQQRIQSFLDFLKLFPDIFRIEGTKVSAKRQVALAPRPPPRPRGLDAYR